MTAVPFEKTSPSPIRFDKKLGLCFGWFCFSKKNGVEYDDLHGDHMPDDELIPAVDTLMAKAASERLIDVEHVGGGRGSIATAVALTEDVAKASSIDTGGTYGVWGSFRPDAALLKSIEAGEAFCLSVGGAAHDVEVLAKSADGAELVKGRKRILRKIELTRLAVVKAGAHEGAGVDLIKSAPAPAVVALLAKDIEGARKYLDKAIARHERHMDGTEAPDEKSQQKMMDDMKAALDELPAVVAKRTPILTGATDGHQHLIDDCDEKAGYTSYETAASTAYGSPYGHSHPWVRDEAGVLTIGEANGHSHTLDTENTDMSTADLAKAQADLTAALAKGRSLLAAAVALSPDQAAFAKSLPADKRDEFLALPEAERIAKATPVHIGGDGTRYFASDDPRMVTLAKSADANAVELAKAREQAEAVTFEKQATATISHLKGTLPQKAAIMKSIAGLPEADRVAVLEILKGADAAMKILCSAPGVGGGNDPVVKSAQGELDAMAAEVAQKTGVNLAKALDQVLSTPIGKRLYDQIENAKRAGAAPGN